MKWKGIQPWLLWEHLKRIDEYMGARMDIRLLLFTKKPQKKHSFYNPNGKNRTQRKDSDTKAPLSTQTNEMQIV